MRFRSLPHVLAVIVISSLLSVMVTAQSFTPVREQKNLSPAALAKLHTLETLKELPPGEWRFHAGDLPHGESVGLDDSSWPLVGPKSHAPKEAVWYRRVIEVPKTLNGYDITGARVWFQFHATANGPMPQIIYFNGRRVALGDDLEPIILFEPAKPGDKGAGRCQTVAHGRRQDLRRLCRCALSRVLTRRRMHGQILMMYASSALRPRICCLRCRHRAGICCLLWKLRWRPLIRML